MNFKTDLNWIIIFSTFCLSTVCGNFFQNCIYTENQCPNKDITFWLYTNLTCNNPIKLNITNISKNIFVESKKLTILIHGYTGHKDFDPNPQIRPVLLKNLNLNVISVDYGPLAEEPCYVQAIYNLDTVAKCTGLMINNLIKNNIFENDDIHVIGFSLGGQTAGLISNYVDQKLSRITGLDIARPGFILRGNNGTLDASDAEFVDVLHTDERARGVLLSAGHVDFYANAGLNQPGCSTQNNTSTGSCNHARAPEYYAESIETELGFYGHECRNWLHFVSGLCRQTKQSSIEKMGYYVSKNARGNYFLSTNSQPPYAKGYIDATQLKSITSPNGFSIENISSKDDENFDEEYEDNSNV